MKVMIGQQRIEVGEHSICHDFTIDAICKLKCLNHVGEGLKAEIQPLQKGMYQGELGESYWKAILKSGRALTAFNQGDCAGIPVGSLILFTEGTGTGLRLQHSMIVNRPDCWIGVNNLGTLGVQGPGQKGLYLTEYENMSTRGYNRANLQGGWSAGRMTSGNSGASVQYTMYYLPLLDEAEPEPGCCCF